MTQDLTKAYFSEADLADVVTGQNINAKNERLREVMDSITGTFTQPSKRSSRRRKNACRRSSF